MKRASGAGAQGVLSSRWFHLAVLALGSAFVLVGAFHGYIWFDESYSVAIANHPFSEIWRIGSGDVHPVLFYWALHVLNLIFGQNILVYRLFTVLGLTSLQALDTPMSVAISAGSPACCSPHSPCSFPIPPLCRPRFACTHGRRFSSCCARSPHGASRALCASRRVKALWPVSRNARRGRGFLRARRFRGGLSSLCQACSAHTCTTLAPCPPLW